MPIRKRNKQRKGKRTRRAPLVMVNRGPGFMPPRFRTTLTWNKSSLMSNVGANFTNVVFTPTDAHDIDPLFGTTAMPGFAELAASYRRYRVNSSRIKAGISNEQPSAITAYVVPVNFNPGANFSTFHQFISSKLARVKLVGAVSGNNDAMITTRSSTQTFGGVRYTGQDDNYSSDVTGAPINNWYWIVGAIANNSALTTSGISYFVQLDIDIEFYELNTPSV